MTEKPPYRVPLMSDIRALPWNGFKVVSTFAGAGGSSTGYRMAGFRIALANEFVPIAQESYRANMAETTVLDGRDIKQVKGAEILERTGIARGELDVFDGSPPCQAFSTAGKRDKGWGTDKRYEHGAEQRNEELFSEYIRLVGELEPRTFVAENVTGLVKGVAKGFFLEILAALKAAGPGYDVEARILDAQWLGVPQARERVIFIGVRRDFGLRPAFPEALRYRYNVRDALERVPGLVEAESDITRFAIGAASDTLNPGKYHEKYKQLVRADPAAPSPTISSSHGMPSTAGVIHPTEKRKFSIAELRRICSFPDDFILKGSYPQQWERLGNSVPPVMMAHVAATLRDRVLIPAAKAAGQTGTRSQGSKRSRRLERAR